MLADVEVPIVIVGFGNADDIVKCLTCGRGPAPVSEFWSFHLRKWGTRAFEALVNALAERGGPCEGGVESVEPASG